MKFIKNDEQRMWSLEDVESKEEVMINFEESDEEEGEGYASLLDDNNEEDYVGVEEED